LSIAVALGVFFLTWAILAEAKEENPWISAGLMASSSMIAAVVVREVILRVRRNSVASAQRRLDSSILSAPALPRGERVPKKLSLERNALLLAEIERKSEAAKVLHTLSESHQEVFLLCEQYIELASRELPNIGVGSPRLGAIKKGRDRAVRLHKYHMLKWAEIGIRRDVAHLNFDRIGGSLESAQGALRVAETALSYYADHRDLLESKLLIESFIASARALEAVERADQAEATGDLDTALDWLLKARKLLANTRGPYLEDVRFAEIPVNIRRISEELGSRI
jgi:hypothetical protein